MSKYVNNSIIWKESIESKHFVCFNTMQRSSHMSPQYATGRSNVAGLSCPICMTQPPVMYGIAATAATAQSDKTCRTDVTL